MMSVVKGTFRGSWGDHLQISGNGAKKSNLFNACIAFRDAPEFRGKLRFDEFAMQTMISGDLPWSDGDEARPWSNHDDNYATEWLQGQDINCGRDTVQMAVETVAHERRFHPVRDWLSGLEWDRKPRLDTWLTYYLGVEANHGTSQEYIQTVGRCWALSAVARIFKPGCKADHVMVVEGRQGARKSTAIKTLAGEAWFTDDLDEFGSKDSAMQMRGVWIIELGEMDHMSRAEVTRIKAAVSRCVDRFRPPYGHRLVNAPRECVFAGTVNHSEYLRDETGNRRFWPVRAGSIDIEALAEDRAQIWAEAVARFRGGEAWWIVDPDMAKQAREEQAERAETDAWIEPILEFVNGKMSCTTTEILRHGLNKRVEDIRDTDNKRVNKCMTMLGFERRSKKVSGVSMRVWVRPSD